MPLYNGLRDTYVIDSIGYRCINGVLEGYTTSAGVTNFSSNTHVTHWYPCSFNLRLYGG
ncbi:MAG: hypothetical protein ACJZ9G_11850 [Rhodospirillales bacterium]